MRTFGAPIPWAPVTADVMPQKSSMHLPVDLVAWLRFFGALSIGIGSLLLAWRVRELLRCVVLALVSHEATIQVLLDTINNQPQRREAVVGAVNHLIDVEEKLGLVLLVVGFVFLGVGMLANAASYLV